MASEYRDKLLSLGLGRRGGTKETVDDHGHGLTVRVTEHFNDRVDVEVRPPSLRLRAGVER